MVNIITLILLMGKLRDTFLSDMQKVTQQVSVRTVIGMYVSSGSVLYLIAASLILCHLLFCYPRVILMFTLQYGMNQIVIIVICMLITGGKKTLYLDSHGDLGLQFTEWVHSWCIFSAYQLIVLQPYCWGLTSRAMGDIAFMSIQSLTSLVRLPTRVFLGVDCADVFFK